MPSPSKTAKSETQGFTGRRSTRLAIAIPITVSGTDSAGESFRESTRTAVINKHGAKLLTLHQLSLGAEISIENKPLGRMAKATVVWVGDRRSPKDAQEVGVQLLEASNIWGIEFPPEDWQEGPPTEAGGKKLDAAAQAKLQEKAAAAKAPPPAEPAPAKGTSPPTADPAAAPAAVAPPTAEIEALLAEQLQGFEERLKSLSQKVRLEAETAVRDIPGRVEAKLADAVDEQLRSRRAQLEEVRGEIERLRGELESLGREAERASGHARARVEEATSELLRATMVEFQGRVRPEIEGAATGFIEETRRRVSEEAGRAMEEFQKQAAEQLARLVQESLARIGSELESFRAQETEKARQEVREAAQTAAAGLADELRKSAETSAPDLRARVQNEVSRSYEEALQAALASGRELIQRAMSEVESSYRAALERIEGQSAAEFDRLASEAAARQAERVAARFIDGLEKKAISLAGDFQAQLEKAVEAARDQSLQEATDSLRKALKELADAGAKELKAQTEEARKELRDDLKSSAKTLSDDTKKRLSEMVNKTVESLNKEATSGLETFRAQVRKEFERFQEQSARDLEGRLRKIAGELQGTLEQQVRQGVQAAVEETVLAFRSTADQTFEQYSNALKKEVGSAAFVLKEWEDEAKSRLKKLSEHTTAGMKSSAEEYQHQVAELTRVSGERVRAECDSLVDTYLDRVQQAASVMQEKGLETLRARLKEMTGRAIDEAAGTLRRQAETDLRAFAGQMAETRDRFASEAEETFRAKIAELFAAVLQPPSKKKS